MVGGVGVAHAAGSAALLHSARTAFVQGMDTMLWACAGIAVASAILALLFLPRRPDGMTGAPRGDAVPPPPASASASASASG